MLERLTALTQQVNPVLSYSEIADLLSVEFSLRITKNACIGRGRRIGIPPRRAEPNGADVGYEVDKTKRRPVPRARPKPRYERLEIFDLKGDSCRWPFGDRPPFLYCGRKVVNGHPYCEEHWRKACGATRERK